MTVEDLKHPVLLGLIALIVFLCVLTGFLASAYFARPAFPMPSDLLGEVQVRYSEVTALEPVARADSVVGERKILYAALSADTVRCLIAVVEKDILCWVCRDLLFEILYDGKGRSIGISGKVDVGPQAEAGALRSFLGELVGLGLGKPVVLGKDVDAITGATKTSEKLVEGFNEASELVQEYLNRSSEGEAE